MCGIAGLFVTHGVAPKAPDLDAVAKIMAHRGPDGIGIWKSPDQRFQAVFRRLAIIDLDGSDQPIHGANYETVLLGNGEIYNFAELRERFADYPYRTNGDMESVLAARQSLGDDYVDALNGMYAIALYDRTEDRLELVRDRMGVKPLYWAKLPSGGVVFGSEIKAIFATGLVSPSINEAAVSAYLAHGYVPAPATLYQGVQKLPPGHRLIVDASGGITETAYWTPHPANDVPSADEDIAAYMMAILEDSIRLQLRSDVPIGALLSGGIDSGLIAALASQHVGQPLKTYTARFEGGAVDESPLAAEVAARYDCEHTVLDIPSGSAAETLWPLTWFTEEPLNDAALLPNFMIQQALGNQVRVTLNGTGGDELFAGYGRYFQLPVEQAYLMLPRVLRNHVITPIARALSPMRGWQLDRGELWDKDRGAYLHAHSTHFPRPIRDLIGDAHADPVQAQAHHAALFHRSTPEADLQTVGLAGDMRSYLPDDLLLLLDRTSMAASVEGRVPFLDHRLVEAALSIPEQIRTPGRQQKGLLRRMAAPLLPSSVMTAPKHGFVSPVPSWMRGPLGDAARRLLTSKQSMDRGWWTQQGVEQLMAAPDQHGYRVYTLLALELSVRMFCETPLTDSAPSASLMDIADAT
jgi:asparagine synthase (glutamine-hydrolysing)